MDQPASRRSFLLGLGAAGTAVPVVAGARPDGEGDDLAALARLAGLQFSDAERKQAEGRLRRQRGDYAALRAQEVPWDLAPCVHFEPLLPGTPAPPAGPGARWEPIAAAAPAGDTDLAFASVDELAALLRQGAVTSRRLTELAIARLQRFDPQLHCVVTLLAEEALRVADQRDEEAKAGRWRSPLHGIPFGAKDLFAWPTAPTTFGAAPYRDQVWNETATVLAKLRDAGAVLVAKLSLGALAMGDLWFGGRTRNPFQPEQGSSGSSAGSASAVAAGLLPFALGTETLGSIVSPCQRCGTGGLRPTFGAVSRHGAMPLSWSMDKVGPIARSAVDLALVFDAIRGADGRDPCARTAAFPWRRNGEMKGLRFGVLQTARFPQRDEDHAFLSWLEEQGGKPQPVSLPEAPYSALLLMLHAEGAAAFDDLTRSGGLAQLDGQDDGDWPNSFRAARAIPAVEYLRAARLRSRLQQETLAALAGIDVLVAPTHGGPTLGCTNLTGHPTLVLPVGRSERDGGRPTVLALVGALHGEAALLIVAERWQQTTDFHRARPALTA